MYNDWDMREGNGSFIELMIGVAIIITTIGCLLIISVGFLFFLDYLVLGNIIYWGFEVVWGLSVLLYIFGSFRWTINPTDWLPIIFGHKIQWDYNNIANDEIAEWVKENVSSLMYAKIEVDAYCFLKKSDYIAFKLRWT